MNSHPTKIRLTYIDGIRSLACLYVVVHHAYLYLSDGFFVFPKLLDYALILLATRGHEAVAVFIFISGFCLMLPFAAKKHLHTDFTKFMIRRAKRILPPYYAVLLMCLIAYTLIPGLNRAGSSLWQLAQPALNGDGILTHCLLIHCFSARWVFKINPPMWSISVEWWMYFLLPILLLPLFRAKKRVAFLFIVMLFGAIAGYLQARYSVLPHFAHFPALFAIGMSTAWLVIADSHRPTWLRRCGLFLGFLFLVLVLLQSRKSWSELPGLGSVVSGLKHNQWLLDYSLIIFVSSAIVEFHNGGYQI